MATYYEEPILKVTHSVSRRRGRPKTIRPKTDTGTPELVMKRLLGETAEALDICLEREIITPQHHWCGIHLRWLYTLRYGAPSVRSVDPTDLGGMEIRSDNPEWRAAREKEYHDAIQQLTIHGYVNTVVNLCIYNERPKFLRSFNSTNEKQAILLTKGQRDIRAGLEVLLKDWR